MSENTQGDAQVEDAGETVDFHLIIIGVLTAAVKTGVLMIFHFLGWLKLMPLQKGWGTWGVVATAVIVAIVVTIVTVMILELAFWLQGCTCFFSLLLVPLSGYIALKMMLDLAPQLITAPGANFLGLLVLGSLLAIAMVPTKQRIINSRKKAA